MNKRRKLGSDVNGATGSSNPSKTGNILLTIGAPVSAFAAAKARFQQTHVASHATETSSVPIQDEVLDHASAKADPERLSDDGHEVEDESKPNHASQDPQDSPDESGIDVQLSIGGPKFKEVGWDRRLEVSLQLSQGATVCCIGRYLLSVEQGVVQIMHSTLFEGRGEVEIFAPSTGPLPIIKCLSREATFKMSSLKGHEDRDLSLARLSPLYRRIWHAEPELMKEESDGSVNGRPTFSIVSIL